MSTIMMLLGLCTLLFCAMGYYALLHVESEISLAYSVITMITVLNICARFCGIRAGVYVFCILSIVFLLIFLIRSKDKKSFFSFGTVSFLILSVLSLYAFKGDFIQIYDDFHQWAAEVKYMLNYNILPTDGSFIGVPNMPPETSLFSAFFQILGGYDEGHMYSSAFFLTAAGVMLPLFRIRWKDWFKGTVYIILVYSGFFTLYIQPYKSLYVDLPCAVWAASTCMAWYFKSDDPSFLFKKLGKTWSDVLMFIPILIFISRIKWGVGLLLWLFTIGFIIVDTAARAPVNVIKSFFTRRWKPILSILIVGIIAFASIWIFTGESFIPANLGGVIEALTISSDKARLTAKTMVSTLFQKTLSSNPNMPFRTVQSVVIIVMLMVITASWTKDAAQKKRITAQAIYYPLCVAVYTLGLYVSYVSVFSYEESVRNATGYRYLSIVVVYGFIIMSGMLLHSAIGSDEYAGESMKSKRLSPQLITAIFLCVLMISNFNEKFIYKASSRHYWENSTYDKISTTKDQIARIEDIISDNDKVYLLSNGYNLEKMNEYPLCVALYYLENRVSNYMRTPWNYNEEGSLTFTYKTDNTIAEFPGVLINEGYTYIWIHSYDDYLEDKFSELFGCDELTTGLYELNFDASGSITLNLVSTLE